MWMGFAPVEKLPEQNETKSVAITQIWDSASGYIVGHFCEEEERENHIFIFHIFFTAPMLKKNEVRYHMHVRIKR